MCTEGASTVRGAAAEAPGCSNCKLSLWTLLSLFFVFVSGIKQRVAEGKPCVQCVSTTAYVSNTYIAYMKIKVSLLP